MKLIISAFIAAGVLASAPALANLDLAKKSNCMACHLVDKKLVGPAYAEVAAKYKGDANAVKMLAAKVKAGSKPGVPGVWGAVPMPPNPNVKDADMEILIKWILAGAK
ncbi:c-type cytochrome [Rhodoferax sp.]|uniref:c-type cytochrome n=1 Tax=Rhodoferax sp. TaxID=50421 RepID=UPI0027681955|nr:c-type cytochrome [Rhodocyclaceae bacterium]MDP2366906.1 c-type cytochrome [Rhodoferax sp.]